MRSVSINLSSFLSMTDWLTEKHPCLLNKGRRQKNVVVLGDSFLFFLQFDPEAFKMCKNTEKNLIYVFFPISRVFQR